MNSIQRRYIIEIAIFAAPLTLCGCAHVDATRDFQRVQTLITEHTGVDASFDPQADEMIASQVEQLLTDGLTVDRAMRIALLNNRAFQSAFFEIGVSRADLVQSTLLTNPSVSLIAKFPEGGGRSHLEFSLPQELVDLWQIPFRKKVARSKLEQTVLKVAEQAVELVSEVKKKYYELLAFQLAEATARESIALIEESLGASQKQLKGGEISRFDVNLQRMTLIDANLELLNVGRDRRVAEAELSRVMGLNRGARLEASDTKDREIERGGDGEKHGDSPSLTVPRSPSTLILRDHLPAVHAVGDETELLTLAMKQRLDARMACDAVRESEHELRLECVKVFPSVIAGFEFERSERRALPGRTVLADTARDSIAAGGLTAPTIQSRAQRDLERRQIIDEILGPSLQITLPLWDQNQAQIAKARFKVSQRRKDFENTLDTVALEVQRASAQLRAAEAVSRYYEHEALPQARENVESARRVYKAGEQGIVALVEAERSLVERRARHVDAVRSYAAALADLEAAVGGRLPEIVATQPAATQPDTRE